MKKFSLLAFTLSFIALVAINPAHAFQDETAFNGWYLGMQGGAASNRGSTDSYSYKLNSFNTPPLFFTLFFPFAFPYPSLSTYSNPNQPNIISRRHSCKATAPVIEITGGINFRTHNWVLGGELGIRKDFMKAKHLQLINGVEYNSEEQISQNLSHKLSMRGGYVMPGEILTFITLGWETKKLKNYWAIETDLFGNPRNRKYYNLRGTTIGAGVEKAFGRFSVRAAYNYFWNKDKLNAPSHSTLIGAHEFNSRFNTHEILIGVFYHF